MPSNTEQLLRDYHDASKRLEAIWLHTPGPSVKFREEYTQLIASARELLSRCIISDDPRSLVALLQEMEYVIRILGQQHAADHLNIAGHDLAATLRRFGHFGT